MALWFDEIPNRWRCETPSNALGGAVTLPLMRSERNLSMSPFGTADSHSVARSCSLSPEVAVSRMTVPGPFSVVYAGGGETATSRFLPDSAPVPNMSEPVAPGAQSAPDLRSPGPGSLDRRPPC